jgi:iron complex transport system ATP-binding protein
MASDTVLTLDEVTVRRGTSTILGPISLTLLTGQRWVVLGPNGAGKSTLLQLISTRIFPSTGSANILDKTVGKVDLFELRTRIGLVSATSTTGIPDNELVRDVVLTAAYAISGRWNESYDLWDESRAIALLTTFGVRSLGDRHYGTLSEGERKRVTIARALMVDPELILLDEPTSGLDLPGREDLLSRFARFASEPTSPASIIVTHHLEEIPAGTTHALLLKNGEIAYAGEIDQVLNTKNVSEVFDYPLTVTKEGARFFARAN